MSEESKTAEGDYVIMGSTAPGGSRVFVPDGLDDPNLTQEERDHRLAIALQQQENAAALDEHKKKHEAAVHANDLRTARSGTFSRLAAVRDKDHGQLHVPSDYVKNDADYYVPPGADLSAYKGAKPQEIADFQLAQSLQKVEQVSAGTAQTMEKILKEEEEDDVAQAHRTERSNYHLPTKGHHN
jgi:hypothetical protein